MLGGAVGGSLLTMLLGFTMGGWVTASKSENTASDQSTQAVISALAPVCVSNFNKTNDMEKQQALLKGTEEWKRAAFVKSAGWASMPGQSEVSTGLANSCAKLILAGNKQGS